MWFVLALAYALAAALHRWIAKPVTQSLNPTTISWVMPLAGLPITLIIAGVGLTTGMLGGQRLGFLQLPSSFWLPMGLMILVIWPVQYYCLYQTLKHRQLSWIFPMDGLVPAVGGMLAWLVFGEIISALSLGSVAVIIGGVVLLNVKPAAKHSVASTDKHPATWYLPVIQAFCAAIAAVFTKMAVTSSGLPTFLIVGALGGIIGQWLLTTLIVRPDDYRQIWVNRRRLALSGTVDGLRGALGVMALALGPVAQVTATFRVSLVFGVIVGVVLEREKLSARQLLASFIIFTGVTLLYATKLR